MAPNFDAYERVRSTDPGGTISDGAAPTGAADLTGLEVVRVALPAGSAAAVDVTVYLSLPRKLRLIRAEAILTTAVGAATVQFFSAVSGGGTQFLNTLTCSGGAAQNQASAPVAATAAMAKGSALYMRCSNGTLAGDVFLYCIAEQ